MAVELIIAQSDQIPISRCIYMKLTIPTAELIDISEKLSNVWISDIPLKTSLKFFPKKETSASNRSKGVTNGPFSSNRTSTNIEPDSYIGINNADKLFCKLPSCA